MIIIGIDPGQTGAIAVLCENYVTSVKDMPVMGRFYGKGETINGQELASIFHDIRSEAAGKMIVVKLEAVSAMPKQGVVSSFHFGEGLGIVQGVIATLGFPLIWILPAVWKRAAGLLKKEKDVSRTLAIQRHPEIQNMLTRKKDCGRADAINIADFGK